MITKLSEGINVFSSSLAQLFGKWNDFRDFEQVKFEFEISVATNPAKIASNSFRSNSATERLSRIL